MATGLFGPYRAPPVQLNRLRSKHSFKLRAVSLRLSSMTLTVSALFRGKESLRLTSYSHHSWPLVSTATPFVMYGSASTYSRS